MLKYWSSFYSYLASSVHRLILQSGAILQSIKVFKSYIFKRYFNKTHFTDLRLVILRVKKNDNALTQF